MARADERYTWWRTTALIVWAVIGILVLAAAAFWGLSRIASALIPFVIAFVIVFLLNAPVRLLEARGWSRSRAALLCFVVGFAIIGGILTFGGPPILHQVESFAKAAPKYLAEAQAAEVQAESRFNAMVLPPWFAGIIKTASAQLAQFVVTVGDQIARRLVTVGQSVARGLLDIFLSIVISFWVLKDLPKIREEIVALAGPQYEDDAEHLLGTVTHVAGGYLRGQSLASLSTASITTVGLTVLHVPYSLVLGLIAFFFNFAPYVGPVTTAMIAGLLGMFVSPLVALAAVGVVIVAQNFTDAVVVPRVMSAQVDLHPSIVIFSLLVGGALFGIPGLLFAIPVAAIGKGLFVYYYEQQTERALSSHDGALFRHRPGANVADTQADYPMGPDASGPSENAE
jgi:predicted PurR-regulated permease PerM